MAGMPRFFAWFILNGWAGLHLFFILSGFLITQQLLPMADMDKDARKAHVRRFYKRRFFRIAPAYYFVVTLITILMLMSVPAQTPEFWDVLRQYGVHLLFLHDIFEASGLEVQVFWTLGTEVKFYILAPFLMIGLLALRRDMALGGIMALMFFLLLIKIAVYHFAGPAQDSHAFFLAYRQPFYMALDSLIGGVLCAFMWRDDRVRPMIERPAISAALFWGGMMVTLFCLGLIRPHVVPDGGGLTYFAHTFHFTLMAFGFVLVTLGALAGAIGTGFLSWRGFHGIALVSYSLYLLHCLLLRVALDSAFWLLGDAAGNGALLWGASSLILFIYTLVPAVLMYRYIEKPMILWSKH